MTEPTQPEEQQPIIPSRRDRLRPLEYVGLSAAPAIFAGVMIMFMRVHPKDMPLIGFAGIVVGVVFIVVLMVIALLGLGGQPSAEDLEARKDLQQPDKDGWH